MKKLAFLTLLALAVAISSCGNGSLPPATTTTTNSNWEAQFTGGTGAASELNFITQFSVTDVSGNSEPLDIINFGFFNEGACFATGLKVENESGSAALTTSSTGQVTGTLNFTVQSIPAGNTLSMTGNLTGTSNGTTTTTGVLSNGIVQGTWTLVGGTGCNGTGNFLMCQVLGTGGLCPNPT